MSAAAINLIVLVAIVAIFAGSVYVTMAALRASGGRRGGRIAKPSRAEQRKVNPKTGELFP
jgi:hypothetical protein